MTFYGTPATGAGWIVPKKYIEKVGEDGFKKAPVGAGPYKFVSFNPGRRAGAGGVRRLLAQDAERQAPGVQVGAGRVDAPGHAQARRDGHRVLDPRARSPRKCSRTPGLTLKATYLQGDVLGAVRRSVGPEVAVGGPAGAPRREPRHRPEGHQRGRDPRARQDEREHHSPELRLLLAGAAAARLRPCAGQEAPGRGGLPQGLRRRRLHLRHLATAISPRPSSTTSAAIGIRTRLRPLERAGFFKAYAEKKLKNLIQGGSGSVRQRGHARRGLRRCRRRLRLRQLSRHRGARSASRRSSSTARSGRRPASRSSSSCTTRSMLRADLGAGAAERPGPRVAEGGLGLIPNHAYSAPYEDLRLKKP